MKPYGLHVDNLAMLLFFAHLCARVQKVGAHPEDTYFLQFQIDDGYKWSQAVQLPGPGEGLPSSVEKRCCFHCVLISIAHIFGVQQ